MDYQIAIPSYARAELLRDKTLAFLEQQNIDKQRITVFVANESESDKYRYVLGHNYRVVIAQKGLLNARRFYNNYYPENTPLLNLDDDLVGLKQRTSDGKLEDFTGSLDNLVAQGFDICAQQKARLWGINPVSNGFFMNDTVTVGLRYICGNFHGSYAGDPVITGADRANTESSGEDFETTLRSFVRYGAVVRFDWVCSITKFFADGGIDAELKTEGISDRQVRHKEVLYDIAARFPDLATIVTKAGNVTNIRLKNISYGKLPRAHV